jgi:hypothetical protein
MGQVESIERDEVRAQTFAQLVAHVQEATEMYVSS